MGKRMRFGVFVPQGWRMDLVEIADPVEQYEAMTRVAKAADELEVFDSIWVYDHFHTVPEPDAGDDLRVLDDHRRAGPRHAAGSTSARWSTCNGYRNPALLAKMASTVDVMSHGRLYCGLGAGWYEHEWRAYGYGFPEMRRAHGRCSARRCEIIDKMWTEDEPSLPGRVLHHRRADQRAEGRAQAAPVVLDRRQRREGHAQAGGPVRRRLQRRRRRSRRCGAQTGGVAPALRRRWAATTIPSSSRPASRISFSSSRVRRQRRRWSGRTAPWTPTSSGRRRSWRTACARWPSAGSTMSSSRFRASPMTLSRCTGSLMRWSPSSTAEGVFQNIPLSGKHSARCLLSAAKAR